MQVGWSLLRNLGWRLLLVLCPLSKSVPPNTVLRDGDRYYLKIWRGWGECLIKNKLKNYGGKHVSTFLYSSTL